MLVAWSWPQFEYKIDIHNKSSHFSESQVLIIYQNATECGKLIYSLSENEHNLRTMPSSSLNLTNMHINTTHEWSKTIQLNFLLLHIQYFKDTIVIW